MTVNLFVYGTLMPGEAAWSTLRPYAISYRKASVPGTLYDTGSGFPAATFGGPDGSVVHGYVVEIADRYLARFDRYESEGRLYRRVAVDTEAGAPADAYEWMLDLDGFDRLPSGRWNMKFADQFADRSLFVRAREAVAAICLQVRGPFDMTEQNIC